MKNIVLNTVVSDNKFYGKLYYDVSTDQLCFKNSKNKITPLNALKKIVKVNESKILYQGVWNSDLVYEVNELVHDPEDDNRLYICISSHKSTQVNPRNDEESWRLICNGTSSTLTPIHSVSKKVAKYLQDRNVINSNINAKNVVNKSYIYAQMINNSTDTYSDIKPVVIMKNSVINIPLKILKDDINKDTDIIITKSGFYKFTYNISYYGTVSSLISRVATVNVDNDRGIALQESVHRSVNRAGQLDDDAYYEDVHNEYDIIQTVNHTFYCDINMLKHQNGKCRVLLQVLFGKKSVGKRLYVQPVRTWLMIEEF